MSPVSSIPATATIDRRRALSAIGWISFTFFLGLLTSACAFYANRTFQWKDAIISDLQSPEENPNGYFASAFATAMTAVFFFQLLRLFHRRLCGVSLAGTSAGSAFFGVGAAGALAIGCLAPFPVSYESVHIPLAFATFICLVAGTGVYLFLTAKHFHGASRTRRRGLLFCCGLIVAILAVLVKVSFTPDFFSGDSFFTTLALWEWVLCAAIVGFLLVLSSALFDDPPASQAGLDPNAEPAGSGVAARNFRRAVTFRAPPADGSLYAPRPIPPALPVPRCRCGAGRLSVAQRREAWRMAFSPGRIRRASGGCAGSEHRV
jgi:Protein of unknown function (DUF998)